MDDVLLLSVEEAGQRLQLSRSKVYDLILSGQLASLKLGKSRRVPVEALTEFIADERAAQGVAPLPRTPGVAP